MRTFVTGATGAIGRPLVEALVAAGHEVAAATRRPDDYDGLGAPIELDLDHDDLGGAAEALADADAAFYLVHALDRQDFVALDRQRARRFADAWGPDRPLVYLGGLGTEQASAGSPHLRSRHEVGKILRDRCATVELRASIVIGPDSIVFRLLRSLGGIAGRSLLPVVVPRAASTLTQPVAQADLTEALIGGLDLPPGRYDVGGPDVVSFAQLLERSALAQGRHLRTIPALPIAADWFGPAAAAIADVDPWATTALLGSMGVETIVDDARRPSGTTPPATSLDQALADALTA